MKSKKFCGYILLFTMVMALITVPIKNVSAQLLKEVTIQRHQGLDRYGTAIAVSESGWQTSDNVVIATGEDFPDALSATPLAKQIDAPILLVGNTLDSSLSSELGRLQVKNVFLVGGEGVISKDIQNQLEAKGLAITRFSGIDRYETALMIANYLISNFDLGSEIVLATGEGFPDALSIAPVAAIKGMPILLSPTAELNDNVKKFISDHNVSKTFVVGGTGVLSENVMQQLPSPERISGKDRYATNTAILNRFSGDLTFDRIYVATGNDFPDALAGSALAIKTLSPILLTNVKPDQISKDFILSKISRISKVDVLGGNGVISEIAINDLLLKSTASDNIRANNSLSALKIVKQGDWLYYYDIPQNGLFKMKSDGSSKTRLTNGPAWYINVVEDWIYYIGGDYDSIWRTRTDGSNTSILPLELPSSIDRFISDLTIYNNRLYFLNDMGLFRADLDGSNTTRFIGRPRSHRNDPTVYDH